MGFNWALKGFTAVG